MAASTVSPSSLIHPSRIPNRWVQLVAGIVAMMAIANLQYAWTIFTKPIQAHLHVTLVAVQWTFTLFVSLETWLVPFEGYLVDKIGPRLMLGVGAIMVGLGWIGSGKAETINSLYFWYGVGGIGAGVVYGGAIGNALKWFPDHRGLCVGLTAAAFGIGTATTIAPISAMLKTTGYQHTFIVWGIIQGFVVLFSSLFLARPPVGWTPPKLEREASQDQGQNKHLGSRYDALANAPPAVVLRHLSDDDHVGFRRPRRHGATQPHGFLLPCG